MDQLVTQVSPGKWAVVQVCSFCLTLSIYIVGRTLGIAEVLDEIVVHVPKASLPNLSRTSRDLSEAALDHIWSDVPELIYLVRALHPLKYVQQEDHWVRVRWQSTSPSA